MTNLEKEVLTIISYGDDYENTPAECFDSILDSFKGSKDQLKGGYRFFGKEGANLDG